MLWFEIHQKHITIFCTWNWWLNHFPERLLDCFSQIHDLIHNLKYVINPTEVRETAYIHGWVVINCFSELKLLSKSCKQKAKQQKLCQSKWSRIRSYIYMYIWYIEKKVWHNAMIYVSYKWKWHSDLANTCLCEAISELFLKWASSTSSLTNWIPEEHRFVKWWKNVFF